MFCPNCGTKTEAGQKYCRACGLSVEKLAGLISEQLPAGALEGSTPEEVAQLLRRKRGVERLLVGIGLTGATVFVLAIIWALVFKIIIEKGEWLQGGIFLGFILAGVVALALVFYRESVMNSLAARGVSDEAAKKLEGATATSKLLPETSFEPIPTVTEHTTELLAAERKGSRQ
jgi:zinc-ribbon domain